ncbi:MAG: hypothetical protein AB8H47_06065 [Bacteroidia bacterium]
MKTRVQIGLFKLLILSLLAVACKPEVVEPDPCDLIQCENGSCVDGSCLCDEYHTGLDCSELKIPITILADAVQLVYVPDACTAYDGGTGLAAIKGADVYVQIRNATDIIYDTRDLFYEDSDCFDGCDFAKKIKLDAATKYQLRVYDRDESSTDDLMGSFSFRPTELLAGMSEFAFTKWLMVEDENSCSNGTFSSSSSMRFYLVDIEYQF